MTLEGDIVADPLIKNGIESHNSDSQCFPEAQTEKKKKKKKSRKNNDSSIDIRMDASELKDGCDPEAECPHPNEKKTKKKRLKDEDASVDIHVDTSKFQDDSIGPNSSRNNNSLESHNKDSQCNPEAEHPQLKKKKSKKRQKDNDAQKDDSIGTKSLESHNVDSQCNTEAESLQPKKKKKSKKRLKDKDGLIDIHSSTPTQKDDSIGTNSCHDPLAEINPHTESKTPAFSDLIKNYNSKESHSVDYQCNPEGKCLQRKEKKRKSKVKDKGSLIGIHDGSYVVKDDSIRTNSCIDSLAEDSFVSRNIDSQCNPEAECPKPKKKKKKKKKLRDEDASVDFRADTSKLKDGSIGANSCHDSPIEIDALIESKTAALPVLSGIDFQCNPETKCPEAMKKKRRRKLNDKDALIDSHIGTSELKDDTVGTDSCRDSLVETIPQTDGQNKRKKKRKKQRLDYSGITDEVHPSPAELDLAVTKETAIISEKQGDSPGSPGAGIVNKCNGDAAPSLVEKENMKKKKKKQKLDSSVIYENAHHPHADGVVVGIGRDGKKNDSRSSSINMVEEHNNNADGAFILNGNGNVKKSKRDKKKKLASVIIEEAHVSPEELDRPDEKSSLMFVKEIDSQSTPSSNQGVAHIEGELRSYGRKRKKSLDSKENTEVTSNSEEIHSTQFSNNEVEGVQDGKVAASSNVLADMNSSDYSNVDFPCPEINDMIEIKKSSGLNVSIEKNNLHQSVYPPVGAHVKFSNKKLLIMDLNGLLVDVVPYNDHKHKHDIVVSKKYVYKRPFYDDFLQFCFEKFNVGVWSSRLKANLDRIVNCLMPDSRHKLLFCWDQSHCTNTGFNTTNNSNKPLFLKELKKLWDKSEPGLPWDKGEYNESNTLLLDDSPYKALSNPANTAIFPHSYDHKNTKDSSLGPGGDLRVYLEKLAGAPNVQEFVAHNPFGQKALAELDNFHQKVLRSVSGNKSSVKIASSSEPS